MPIYHGSSEAKAGRWPGPGKAHNLAEASVTYGRNRVVNINVNILLTRIDFGCLFFPRINEAVGQDHQAGNVVEQGKAWSALIWTDDPFGWIRGADAALRTRKWEKEDTNSNHRFLNPRNIPRKKEKKKGSKGADCAQANTRESYA